MNQTPESEPKREITPGQVVGGKWRVLRVIGRGGMGAVYEAQNVAIGKRAALKFIDADHARRPEVASRFQQEAEAASLVESAHIVQVFDSGTTDQGVPYIVMELLRGEDLRTRLRRLRKLSTDEAVHIIGQVLRGLRRAHEAGIVHRDLKPDNVFLVDRDDEPLFVKLVDFGISKLTRRDSQSNGPITRQGVVLGTPSYMSPEQAQGLADVDQRTDLWAVGAILFECLAGRPPYVGDVYESIIVAACTTDAPLLTEIDRGIPPALAAIVHRALARDRNVRFQSADAMLESLQGAGFATARRVAEMTPRPPTRAKREMDILSRDHAKSPPVDGARPQPARSKPEPSAPGRRGKGFRMFWLGVFITICSFCVTLAWIHGRRAPARSSMRPAGHRLGAPEGSFASRESSVGTGPTSLPATTEDGVEPPAIQVASASSQEPGAPMPLASQGPGQVANEVQDLTESLPADTAADATTADATDDPAPDRSSQAAMPRSPGTESGAPYMRPGGHSDRGRGRTPGRAKTMSATDTNSGNSRPPTGVARGLEIKTTYP